jgi:hypothetical protein
VTPGTIALIAGSVAALWAVIESIKAGRDEGAGLNAHLLVALGFGSLAFLVVGAVAYFVAKALMGG